jgi:hypothetical protein
MENSPINELAIKIYNNHKDLLDLIFEVRPDAIRQLDGVLREFIESKGMSLGSQSKGYVRFLPEALKGIIPKIPQMAKGWSSKESFLFEFSNWNEKRVTLKAVISPGEKNCRDILSQVLRNLPGSQKPSGEQWLTYHQMTVNVNYTMLSEQGEDEIRKTLNKQWQDMESMISKITDAILTKKNELIELANTVES